VFTGEPRYEHVAVRVLEDMTGLVQRAPLAFGHLLAALDTHLAAPQEVAIIGAADSDDTRALLAEATRRFRPNTVIALLDPRHDTGATDVIPLLAGRTMRDGRATAFVCQRFTCRAPVVTPDELQAELERAPA
jgi:uncharacterized protein